MKEFIEMMLKDFGMENFTWREVIMFGVIVPAILIAIMALAGWMDHLSGLV